MTSSTNEIVSDRKRKKGENRAHPRPEKVRGSRVSKWHRTTHCRESLLEIQSLIENVRQDAQNERAGPEVMSSSEDDAYEHTGTDQDCSEGSGSPTDQDTPTRLALAKRRQAKGKHREKIISRHLASAKDLARTACNTPSSRFSSSIASSSPCGRRTTATARSFLLSPATDLSLPPPGPSATNPRFLLIEPLSCLGDVETSCADTPHVRKNTVIGAERQLLDRARQLLDRARESILDYTLFRDPFPSALEFTGFIHSAWTDWEAWHDLRIEPSTESLNNASTRQTKSI